MAPMTFDQRFAGVPAAQRERLERFWLDHPYTERLPDGTSWHYIAMGRGRRLLVLLPHALFPADAWFELATALEDRYRLLIPDGYALQTMFDPVRIAEALVQMIEASRSWETQVKMINTAKEIDDGGASLMRLDS